MKDLLYIVGNGFDIHHGIKSAYAEFGKYLNVRDPEVYSIAEKYFDVDAEFWSDFEQRLASFDTARLIDDAGDLLVGYGSEQWKDADNHSYPDEIKDSADAISVKMKGHFVDWIRSLTIPVPSAIGDKLLHIDNGGTFMNFNYTDSL